MNMARVKAALGALVIFLIAIEIFQPRRINPPMVPSRSLQSHVSVPPEVYSALLRSCGDCHSNQTRWPWYSRVAPISWIIAGDVHDARAKLNFSEWGDYPPNKREERLEEICEQVTNGDMPDPKYLLIHRSARLAPAERDAVCQWTEDSRQY